MSTTLCDPYFWEDIQVFANTLNGSWTTRQHGICVSEAVNVFVLNSIFALILTGILVKMFDVPMITTFFIVLFFGIGIPAIMAPLPPKKEAFQPTPIVPMPIEEEPEHVTFPTPKNPFMNVLINEIKYNPTRPPAASTEEHRQTLDDFFRVEFTSDPTDVFGRSQSQRQFITMPSTTIPNDQESYQNWLYKIPGKTCKEGGREACLPGTDGGKLPWINVER